MLFPNVCAGSSAAVTRVVEYGVFFVHSGCSLVSTSFAGVPPSVYRTPGNEGVPIAGHARWTEVGGGTIYVTPGEFTGLH